MSSSSSSSSSSLLLLLLLTIVCCAVAQPAGDAVTKLPLWSEPITGQYSGYLKVEANEFHYWFVEAETNAPSAPVVLWFNGGPGCSSLDGYWYEHGPLHFAKEKELKLVKNPYSWNKVANILYLEAPPGVGFSYPSNPNNVTYTDKETAQLNYAAIKEFFKAFPKYATNKFWISGESYAGIYVPSVAQLVAEGKAKGDNNINFQGVMVGNGVTNGAGENFLNVQVKFLHGHGILSDPAYKKIVSACTNVNNPSHQCIALAEAAFQMMNGVNVYDIYSDCAHQRPGGGLHVPCVSSFFGHEYLNMPEVKKAIHVREDIDWEICSSEVGSHYQATSNSMVPIYQELLTHGLSVLIYSGDVDFAVPFTGTQHWVYEDMNLTPMAGRDWTQWYFNDQEGKQVAGFVSDFHTPNHGRFTFATIRGSGHMVPQFKPIPALVMFQKFISGQPL